MNAVRNTATPPEVTPDSHLVQYHHSKRKNSNDGDRSQQVIENKRAKAEPPNKSLKIMVTNKKRC